MRDTSLDSIDGPSTEYCLTERAQVAITQPEVVRDFLCPLSEKLATRIENQRSVVKDSIHASPNLIIITGPQSFKSPDQNMACAQWIASKQPQLTKHTTTVLMKLSIHAELLTRGARQPYFLTHGLINTRQHLMELAQLVPLVCEVEDPIAHVYFQDLYSMGMISDASASVSGVLSGCPFPLAVRSDKVDYAMVGDIGTPRLQLGLMDLGQIGLVYHQGNGDCLLVLKLDVAVNINSKDLQGKILIDIKSMSTQQSYKSTLDMVTQVVSFELRSFIVGFIIDSGDQYIQVEPIEHDEQPVYSAISDDIHRKAHRAKSILGSLVSSYTKVSAYLQPKHSTQYASLYYADKLIGDIDSLMD